MKTCSRCKESKSVDCFHKNKSNKSGLSPHCKECKKVVAREEYLKNIDRYKDYRGDNKEKAKTFMDANRHRYKGKYKETEKAWRKQNADRLKKQKSEYYQKNKESLLLKNKKYREQNKKTISAQKKKWVQANKSHVNAHSRNYIHKRLKEDHVFAITKRLRTRMLHAINKGEATKNKNSIKLIGCTPQELCEYLQSLFIRGMTWGNYGEWHLDHIIPCASFDLTDIEEQKKCFHYSNLQPLWAVDNLKKGSKIL